MKGTYGVNPDAGVQTRNGWKIEFTGNRVKPVQPAPGAAVAYMKRSAPPGRQAGYVPFFQFSGRSDLTAAPARHISEFRHAPSSTSSFSR